MENCIGTDDLQCRYIRGVAITEVVITGLNCTSLQPFNEWMHQICSKTRTGLRVIPHAVRGGGGRSTSPSNISAKKRKALINTKTFRQASIIRRYLLFASVLKTNTNENREITALRNVVKLRHIHYAVIIRMKTLNDLSPAFMASFQEGTFAWVYFNALNLFFLGNGTTLAPTIKLASATSMNILLRSLLQYVRFLTQKFT
jgi:hypothetical protein